MWLGAHIGIAEGLAEAPSTGRSVGCDAIQIFSKSPQMWKGATISPEAAAGFREAVGRVGLHATGVHHGYLANLASPKKAMLTRSRRAFVEEIERAQMLGVDALIVHPGAHLGSGVETGLATIAASLNWAFETTPDATVRVLLENAAGQGTALCGRFDELREVLSHVERPDRIGVALDTCHLFANGFDFRTADTYGTLLDQIGSTIGVERVRAFHLNDAKAALGSHLDRHQNIGSGEIGLEGFRSLLNDPRWAAVPGYLETPLDDRGYDLYATDLTALRTLLPGATTETTAGPAHRRAHRTG